MNYHRAAYLESEVDALITFEPVKTQLVSTGAIRLFDSTDVPGRIIDVLAVLPQAIEQSPNALARLIESHFLAREYFFNDPAHASEILAKRLQLPSIQVPSIYEGIHLPDTAQNYAWLAGPDPRLEHSASELVEIMSAANLLPAGVSAENLVDANLLPPL